MTERGNATNSGSNGGSVTALTSSRARARSAKSRSLSARQFQSLRSELLDRLQFAGEHGVSFSGARDLYAAGGYPRKLTNRHYLELYERGDIAERLVEAYPKATWSPGTSIFEDEDPDNVTDWEIRVNDLFTRLDIWNVFKRADILSRVAEHGYSVILIGDNSRTTFDQELPTSVDLESLIYLQPLHEKNARILDFDEDLYSERFGLPLYYQLNLGKGKSQSQRQPKVHWSRVIHFTEGGLDNNVYGPPALRSIYNRLMDMEKIYTAGSEAAFKRMDPGALFTMKDAAEIDPGASDTEVEQAVQEMRDQITEFYHGSRRYLLGENIEATQLNAPVHNFGANIDSIIKVIAGAKEFPQRKLTGSEEAQLASEQDRSSWQDSIAQRRLNVAEPHVRAFVERVGGDSNPEEWDIFWPDKGELNLHEKAELVERLARANHSQFQADGTLVFTADEIRDMVDYDALEQENEDDGQDRDDVDPDAPIVSDNRGRQSNRSLKSGRYTALLTTKRKHIERKLKSRGVVLVNPHDNRHRSLSHADDRDEQTAVRRIADNARSGFAAMMTDLWASTFNDDTTDVLRLSLDNLERAESFAMSLVDEMETRARLLIKDRLASVMERTAKASLRVVERRGSFSARRKVGRINVDVSGTERTGAPSIDGSGKRQLKSLMDFNIANPRAIEWARTRSSALITEIGSSTREAVKSMIANGIKEGRAPRLIAKEIRERVGLRSDQFETLRSFAATGATEKQIERRAKQLLKQRSELIARTETLRSSNQGLREMWYQARDNDLLPADVKREWIATADDRTRDEHADLDGEQVGLDEQFSLGFEPGEEPACRCSQGIV